MDQKGTAMTASQLRTTAVIPEALRQFYEENAKAGKCSMKCSFCSKVILFTNAHDVRDHVLYHGGDAWNSTFRCTLCRAKSFSWKTIRDHLTKKHAIPIVTRELEDELIKSELPYRKDEFLDLIAECLSVPFQLRNGPSQFSEIPPDRNEPIESPPVVEGQQGALSLVRGDGNGHQRGSGDCGSSQSGSCCVQGCQEKKLQALNPPCNDQKPACENISNAPIHSADRLPPSAAPNGLRPFITLLNDPMVSIVEQQLNLMSPEIAQYLLERRVRASTLGIGPAPMIENVCGGVAAAALMNRKRIHETNGEATPASETTETAGVPLSAETGLPQTGGWQSNAKKVQCVMADTVRVFGITGPWDMQAKTEEDPMQNETESSNNECATSQACAEDANAIQQASTPATDASSDMSISSGISPPAAATPPQTWATSSTPATFIQVKQEPVYEDVKMNTVVLHAGAATTATDGQRFENITPPSAEQLAALAAGTSTTDGQSSRHEGDQWRVATPAMVQDVRCLSTMPPNNHPIVATWNQEQPTPIIWIGFENMVFLERADNIQRALARCGMILRIYVWREAGHVQALVQFLHMESAVAAKQRWDGELFYNRYRLSIRFCDMPCVRVKYNTTYTRDYTNPYLPKGPY